MEITAKELYEFELKRRAEINESLKHTIQLAIGEIGFILIFAKQYIDREFIGGAIFYSSIWISLLLSISALGLCAFGGIYFKIALPNSAKDLEGYRKKLIEFDAEKADAIYGDFLRERWIENATKNSERNRQKSRISLYARLTLIISAVPLTIAVISSFPIPFPL